jgi:hypothetical protein
MAGINATKKNILEANKRADRAFRKELENDPYFSDLDIE